MLMIKEERDGRWDKRDIGPSWFLKKLDKNSQRRKVGRSNTLFTLFSSLPPLGRRRGKRGSWGGKRAGRFSKPNAELTETRSDKYIVVGT